MGRLESEALHDRSAGVTAHYVNSRRRAAVNAALHESGMSTSE